MTENLDCGTPKDEVQGTPGAEVRSTLSVAEVTGLIALINGMMNNMMGSMESRLVSMESRLMVKLDENTKLSSDRWVAHDRDLAVRMEREANRFEKIEKVVGDHLARDREDQLIMEARVRPVKTFAEWITKNWKTAMLILALITTTLFSWIQGIEHVFTNMVP